MKRREVCLLKDASSHVRHRVLPASFSGLLVKESVRN